MPIVALPDGRRANFPDDMPREQIKQIIAEKFPDAVKARVDPATNQPAGVPEFVPPGVEGYNPQTGEVERTGAIDKAGAFSTAAVRGVPIVGPALDSATRMAAAGLTAPGSDKSFEERYREMGGIAEKAQRDNPKTALAGELTGAIAPMVGVGATALGGRVLGMGEASLGARTLASGASNAAIAGTDTAVRGGDMGDVAKSALIGGGFGLVAPAAGDLAGAAFGQAANWAKNKYQTFFKPKDAALTRVGQAQIMDAKNTAAPLLNASDEAAAAVNGQQLLNVDRGGQTTRELARSAANNDPEAWAVIAKTSEDRFKSQGPRTQSFIDRLTGGATDDLALQDSLKAAAKRTNGPAYAKAEAHPAAQNMWDQDFGNLMRAPAFVKAAKEAETRGANRAAGQGFKPIKSPFSFGPDGSVSWKQGVRPTLQFWNQVKINLDDAIQVARRTGAKGEAGDLQALKDKLVSKLDSAVPDYKTARQGAAGFFGAEDALEAGKKFVMQNKQNNEVRRALSKMSKEERTTFAVGFASELKDQVASISDRQNVINRMFASPQSREKIELALGKKAATELEQFVKVEHAMDMLRGTLGNSTTAKQLIQAGMANGGIGLGVGTASGLYTGDWQTAILTGLAAQAAKRGGTAMNDRVTKEIAKLLVADNPQAMKRAVQMASQSPAAAAALETIQTVLGSLARGVADSSARPERQPLEITVGRP